MLLQNVVALSLLDNCSFNALWYCFTEFYVRILIRTSGGGVELSWALSKTLCRQQIRKSRTFYCELGSPKWGSLAPTRASVRLVLGQGWGQGWSGVPWQLEGKTLYRHLQEMQMGSRLGLELLVSMSSVVNLGDPSPAAGVSLQQDIVWAFVAALGAVLQLTQDQWSAAA